MYIVAYEQVLKTLFTLIYLAMLLFSAISYKTTQAAEQRRNINSKKSPFGYFWIPAPLSSFSFVIAKGFILVNPYMKFHLSTFMGRLKAKVEINYSLLKQVN